MSINDRVAVIAAEATEWRRDFHRHPELLYEVHRTSARVAELLKSFGCDEVVTGLGRTGVVGVIRGREPGRTIGLRADMDALPITETRASDHASTVPGLMHACGHDGHTAMLLGAARHLTESRAFAGTVVLVFQPAEEGGAGAKAMLDDGLMDRFGIEEIYGVHNMPGLPLGHFATRPGPIMAASNTFEIRITGHGGHAAKPHICIDPIVAGSQIVTALQAIVARGVDPIDSAVVSVTRFHAGTTANNIIPQTAVIGGTVRTLQPETRTFVAKRFADVVEGIGRAQGVKIELDYEEGYPVVVNHPAQTAFAAAVAREVAGEEPVSTDMNPSLGGEDFAYMLEVRPGAFLFLGNGDTAGLHHPDYDFDDRLLVTGIRFWTRLVETALPL
jgi:hippurate hydrolase